MPIDVASVLQILWVNLLLSSDNAVAIGLVAHRLAPAQKRVAIVGGVLLSVMVRTPLTYLLASLIALPGVRLVAGLLVLVVAVRLLKSEATADAGGAIAPAPSVGKATLMVLAADLVMSVENTLAIAGISRGDVRVLAISLALSALVVMAIGGLVAKLMDRWPGVAYAGAAFLGYVASQMLLEDGYVIAWAPPLQQSRWIVSVALVVLVLVTAVLLRRILPRRSAQQGGAP
jgi:YjbE family integral membrane protein